MKRNLLKRLYGEEKITKDESSGSSDENSTSDNNTATKPKIYSALPAPVGYKNVKQCNHSPVKTNDNEELSDSGDEDNTHSHGKRRRRRHRKNESEVSDKPLEIGAESLAAHGNQGLTKNQKRKLKKKRRKEKQKQQTTSLPFSYVNIKETEQETGYIGVKNQQDSPQITEDQVKAVVEFVDAVWDLYKQEGVMKKTLSNHHYHNWTSLLSWIQMLEKSMDKDQVLHDKMKCIYDIKTSLILNNKSKAVEEIKKLKDLTNNQYDTESVEFLCELMEYWMTNVMPGS